MKTAVTIALFCAGGGVTRYYLSDWISSVFGKSFPFGTFAVNVVGAYCVGLIMEFTLFSTTLSDTLRIGLTAGFMGGLTTFSTFSYETFLLLKNGQFVLAFINIIASVSICLLFTWLGAVTIKSMS